MTQFAFALTSTEPYMLLTVPITTLPVTDVPASAAVPVGRVVPEFAAQSVATRFPLEFWLFRIETDTFVILKPYVACGRIVNAMSSTVPA